MNINQDLLLVVIIHHCLKKSEWLCQHFPNSPLKYTFIENILPLALTVSYILQERCSTMGTKRE